ncbi:hypothetical protein C8R44DRAFT_885434 [Mycena epipterygia]|nr:hypothetical protein C8R44DRAFT_885434 [Mycena epipterygia]
MLDILAIPELLDLTIDQLSNSGRDLYACAVVSKLWRRRAQYHLFSNISITRALRNEDTTDARVAPRLAEVIENSPHLGTLIRSVDVSLEVSVLGILAPMPLPNLREVTLRCTSAQRALRADRAVIADVQSILHNPAIQIINLEGRYPSIPVLNEYFHDCSRNIITLKGIQQGRFIEFDAAGTNVGTDDEELGLDENVPPKLDLVALAASTNFGQWLRNPRCPFAFSRLTMIVVMEAYWSTLQRTLVPSLPRLEYLKLLMFDGEQQVDLSPFPLLRKFKISVAREPDMRPLLTVLARLPPTNRISVVNIRLHTVMPAHEGLLCMFDAGLAKLGTTTMRALVRVEFDLPLTQSVSAETFTSWMPQAAAKDWLDVLTR